MKKLLAILSAVALFLCMSAVWVSAEPLPEKKLIFVGDSVTEGVHFTSYDDGNWAAENFVDCYPKLVVDKLNAGDKTTNYTFYNAAISGSAAVGAEDIGTTALGDTALSWMDHSRKKDKLQYGDMLFIMLGSNDAGFNWSMRRPLYKEKYTAIVNAYRAINPDIEVYILTSPATMRPTYSAVLSADVVPMQYELAAELGTKLIDVYAASGKLMADEGEGAFIDPVDIHKGLRLHPGAEGHQFLAEVVYAGLTGKTEFVAGHRVDVKIAVNEITAPYRITLPVLPNGGVYGAPTATSGMLYTDARVEGNELLLTLSEPVPGAVDSIGIPVTGMTEYNDFTMAVHFEVTKDAYQGQKEITGNIPAGLAGAWSVALPALPEGCDPDVVGITGEAITDGRLTDVYAENGRLTFTAAALEEGTTVTVTVPMSSSEQYAPFDVTVNIAAVKGNIVTLTPDPVTAYCEDNVPAFTYTAENLPAGVTLPAGEYKIYRGDYDINSDFAMLVEDTYTVRLSNMPAMQAALTAALGEDWFAVPGDGTLTVEPLPAGPVLLKLAGEWVYVENGAVNTAFSGFVKHAPSNTWFYVTNGYIDWNLAGAFKHPTGIWFIVKNGQIDWSYNGFYKANGVWFWFENGQINWNITGLYKHPSGTWFYVKNAQIDWGYTGFGKHNASGTWFYCENGSIAWSKSGAFKHPSGAWFIVSGGQINWNYTGLYKAGGIWFYFRNGQLDWGYNGKAVKNGVTFNVRNGQVVF